METTGLILILILIRPRRQVNHGGLGEEVTIFVNSYTGTNGYDLARHF